MRALGWNDIFLIIWVTALSACAPSPPQPAPPPAAAAPPPPPPEVAHAGPSGFILERKILYRGSAEPTSIRLADGVHPYVLYVYLLMQQGAHQDQKIAGLRAYACDFSRSGDTPTPLDRGVFFVPARSPNNWRVNELDRNAVFSFLLEDDGYGYDYAEAMGLMTQIRPWSRARLDPRGIFIVELDAPITRSPSRGRAYNLAGLRPDEIEDWIMLERENIQVSWVSDTMMPVNRAKPSSWWESFRGLGQLAAEIDFVNVAEVEAKPLTDSAHCNL